MKGLEELKRMAYENACCRCQYYKDKECTNKGDCVWKTIEKELEERDEYELKYAQTHTALCKLREESSKREQALKILREEIGLSTIIYGAYGYLLSEEQKDLLKEVLL